MSEDIEILLDGEVVEIIVSEEITEVLVYEVGLPGPEGPPGPVGPQGGPGTPEEFAKLSRALNEFAGRATWPEVEIGRGATYDNIIKVAELVGLTSHNGLSSVLSFNLISDGAGTFWRIAEGVAGYLELVNGMTFYAVPFGPAEEVVTPVMIFNASENSARISALSGNGSGVLLADNNGFLSKIKRSRADEKFIAGEYSLLPTDTDFLLELNAAALTTELIIDPALCAKETIRIRCADDTNGASVSSTTTIELKNWEDVSNVGLTKRSTINLYSTGTKLIEL